MPRTTVRGASDELSHDQWISLRYGDTPGDEPAFLTDTLRRAAWDRERDQVMPHWVGKAIRPDGWWSYDAPGLGIKRPRDPDQRTATLWRAGQLTETEVATVMQEWRKYFDKAQGDDFTYTLGPGEILEGDAARRAHYRWAGVPRELIHKWTAERKRAAKTIEALGDIESAHKPKERPHACQPSESDQPE
jgi:hypothetical protein